MNPATLETRGLAKAYGKKRVLRGMDLDAGPGSVTAILGQNGSGKTTFMRCLLGLHVFQEGSVRVLGEDVRKGPAYRRHIGYMPQIPSFPENLSVREIADLVTRVRGVKPDFARGGGLGVEAFLDQKWKTLSGGMKQKVNASLAVAFDAPLLVLDEPTASLDPDTGDWVRTWLERYRADSGCTILLASHNMAEVHRLCSQVLMLKQGRIVDQGTPDELLERYGREDLEEVFLDIARDRRQAVPA